MAYTWPTGENSVTWSPLATRKTGKAVFIMDSRSLSYTVRAIPKEEGGSGYGGSKSHLHQKSDVDQGMCMR